MAALTQGRSDNVRLAVLVIVLTVLSLSLGDAVIKSLSANLVLWQIFVLRSLLAAPVLLFILRWRFGSVSLKPKATGWVIIRSFMLGLMWVIYYASLPYLQLSIAAAAYYTLPIFITMFSALLVGEKVSRVGWGAIILGFVGVCLILKPATDDFNIYVVPPLLSAMLYALAMILTRTKCRDEHPLILAGMLNLTFVFVGLCATAFGDALAAIGVTSPSLSPVWTPMGARELIAIVLLGAVVLVGSVGTAIAYQNGPSSVIATFDFTYVGFAVIWGFLLFSETPGAMAVIGMVLIAIAGFLAVRN